MTQLDKIKNSMAAGDVADAAKALESIVAAEPGNLQAKMLYGICRHMMGDDETFKQMHDEIAPLMKRRSKDSQVSTDGELWEKFDSLFKGASEDALVCKRTENKSTLLTIGNIVLFVILVSALAVGAVRYFGRDIVRMICADARCACAYAGPDYHDRIQMYDLYAAPPDRELQVENHGKFSDLKNGD